MSGRRSFLKKLGGIAAGSLVAGKVTAEEVPLDEGAPVIEKELDSSYLAPPSPPPDFQLYREKQFVPFEVAGRRFFAEVSVETQTQLVQQYAGQSLRDQRGQTEVHVSVMIPHKAEIRHPSVPPEEWKQLGVNPPTFLEVGERYRLQWVVAGLRYSLDRAVLARQDISFGNLDTDLEFVAVEEDFSRGVALRVENEELQGQIDIRRSTDPFAPFDTVEVEGRLLPRARGGTRFWNVETGLED